MAKVKHECSCGTTVIANFGKSKQTTAVCKGCGVKYLFEKNKPTVRA